MEILAELCEDDVVKDSLTIDLFEEDLLDSLAFAELLYAIEEQFGVIIAPSAVAREDVNTPEKIIALVREKLDA